MAEQERPAELAALVAAQQHQVAEAVRQAAERLGEQLSRQAAGWYPGAAALAAQVDSDQGGWAGLVESVARLGEGQRQVVAAQLDREHLAELARALPARQVPLAGQVYLRPGEHLAAPLDQLADRVGRLAGEVEAARQELDRQEAADPAGLEAAGLAGVLVPRGAAHPGAVGRQGPEADLVWETEAADQVEDWRQAVARQEEAHRRAFLARQAGCL